MTKQERKHPAAASTKLCRKLALSDEELQLHHRWEHDPVIHHLHTILGEGETLKETRLNELRASWLATDSPVERFFIESEGRPVGTASIHVDPPWMTGSARPAGWLGLCIGEADARGKGVGRRVMELLHERCRELDCVRIELGVFEFNDRAHHLYRSMGYRQIGTVPDFTWYANRWWSDIRLELPLR